MAQCLEGQLRVGEGLKVRGCAILCGAAFHKRFMEPNLDPRCAIEIEKRIHLPSIPNYWGINPKIDVSRDSSSIRARVLLSVNKI